MRWNGIFAKKAPLELRGLRPQGSRRRLFHKISSCNTLIISHQKIIQKFFSKSVARVKKWCTFASAIDRNDDCEVL